MGRVLQHATCTGPKRHVMPFHDQSFQIFQCVTVSIIVYSHDVHSYYFIQDIYKLILIAFFFKDSKK